MFGAALYKLVAVSVSSDASVSAADMSVHRGVTVALLWLSDSIT